MSDNLDDVWPDDYIPIDPPHSITPVVIIDKSEYERIYADNDALNKMVDNLTRRIVELQAHRAPDVPTIAEIVKALEFHEYVAGCVDDGISPTLSAIWRAQKALKSLLPRPSKGVSHE